MARKLCQNGAKTPSVCTATGCSLREAEEAQWWYDHREDLTKAFEDAAAKGDLHSGSVVHATGGPPGGQPRRF